MRLFGEFLIERQAITEEHLLSALIAQIRAQPPICETAVAAKIFSTKDVLSILSEQTRKKIGFIEAAKGMNLWSEAVSRNLEAKMAEGRMPLGRVLVDQGVLTLETVSKLLDEYWGELGQAEIQPLVQPGIQTQLSSVLPAVEVVAEPPRADQLSPAIEEFCDVFSSAKREELENLFKYMTDWKPPLSEDNVLILQSTKDTVHLLVGSARLANAEQCEKILSLLEGRIGEILKQPDESNIAFSELSHMGALSLAVMWDLRCALSETAQESMDGAQIETKVNEVLEVLSRKVAS